MCHHLGVVNRRQDRRGEQQAHENQGGSARVGAPGDDEHDEREQRSKRAPARRELIPNGLHGRSGYGPLRSPPGAAGPM